MPTERQSPDAIVASSELAGAVTAIDDDPDSPDASWLTASSNNVATMVSVSFPTPTGNPTVGAGLQEFRAQVRKFNGTGTPQARIELWQNGVLIRAGTNTGVTSTTGVVLSFTWNANEIAVADGSQVECRVIGTQSGGSPSVRATVEVGAVEWNVTYDTPATVYTQTLTGSVTAAGGMTRGINKATAGSITASGVVSRLTSCLRAGVLTPVGNIRRHITLGTAFAGSITPAATLVASLVFLQNVQGSITVAGAVGKLIYKGLAGTTTAAGTLTKRTARVLTGSITAAGARAKHTGKMLAASITIAATISRGWSTTHSVSGSLTLSGIVAGLYQAYVEPEPPIPPLTFIRRFTGRR